MAEGDPSAPTLRLLTRAGCELCDQMREQLAELAGRCALPPVVLSDVDDDPRRQRRYGLKIPVLLWGDEAIAVTRLDPEEILRLFRRR